MPTEQEQSAWLQAALDSMAQGVALVERDGRLVAHNRRLSELLGILPKVLAASPVLIDLLRSEAIRCGWGDRLQGLLERLADDRDFDLEIDLPDGRMLGFRGQPDGAGRMIIKVTDLTRRKRARDVLRENEERLRQAVRFAGMGIFDHDHLGGGLYWSPEMKRIWGWIEDQPVTMEAMLERVHPDDRKVVTLAVGRAHDPAGDGLFDIDYRIVRNGDGDVRWVSNRSQTFFDVEGPLRRPVRTVGAVIDITDHKRAVEALGRAKEKLEFAIEGSGIGLWDWDIPSGRIRIEEPEVPLIGFEGDEKGCITLEAWRHLCHPEDLPRIDAAFAAHLRGDAPRYHCEVRMRHKSGEWIWALGRGKVVEWDARGAPRRMAGTYLPTTERKRAEEALAAQEERLRLAMEASHQGWFDVNLQTGEGRVSEEYAKILGYAHGAFGTDLQDWINGLHPADRDGALAAFRECIASGGTGTIEYRRCTSSGAWKWIRSVGRVVSTDGEGRPLRMMGTHADISELKQVEEALQESVSLRRRIFDSSRVPIAVIDPVNLSYVDCNPAATRAYGFVTREETLASHLLEVLAAEQYDGRTAVEVARGHIEEALTAGAVTVEWRHRRPGGETWDAEVHLMSFRSGERQLLQFTLQDVTERKQIVAELERHHDHLEELVAERTAALEAEIAERRNAEEEVRRLNASLNQHMEELVISNRELESFSYTVSHDLRAPLRSINGFATLLNETERAWMDPESGRLLDRVVANTRKMGELIDDILEYSRIGRAPMEPAIFHVEAIVGEVVGELWSDYPRAQILIDTLPPVRGDRAMVRQIFSNLIGNALKFSSKVDEPRIKIGVRPVAGHPEFFVADNGAGFDMGYAGKLFGMFQRMHAEAEFPGTGVGLSIVKRLIERHGGTIRAEAAPGQGATFSFTLPSKH
ncbi:MAG: PAS domain-containing protein [Rhodocyclaceae bacterium]